MLWSLTLSPSRPPIPSAIPFSSSAIPSSSALRTQQFDLNTYWATLIRQIYDKLDSAIPVNFPESIYKEISYSVIAKGGKHAPPVMCIKASELFGGHRGYFPHHLRLRDG